MLDGIKLHVDAKRYLCESTAVTTLHFLMIRSAALRCRAAYSRWSGGGVHRAGGRGRRGASAPLDDMAKVAGLATPSLEHFLMPVPAASCDERAPRATGG